MAVFNIKTVLEYDVKRVWNIITDVENYNWRSDLSRTEIVNDTHFIEYAKNNYPTKFKVTCKKEFERWEFDIDNGNIKGHWTGIFTKNGSNTEIDFTEEVTAKKFFMRPFLKAYMKNQQNKFISDLEKKLSENI